MVHCMNGPSEIDLKFLRWFVPVLYGDGITDIILPSWILGGGPPMANLLDYLDWRGDLTLAQAPFNEVDNLILAEVSFVDLSLIHI